MYNNFTFMNLGNNGIKNLSLKVNSKALIKFWVEIGYSAIK